MNPISPWHANADEADKYPPLSESIEVDVAIVGGGITGTTTALHLVNAGKKVAILEKDRVGDGTSGNSTGNLYVATQPFFQDKVKKFNLSVAKAVAESRKMAIDEIENITIAKNIDCHFSRRPWYCYADQEQNIAFLEKEAETFKDMDIGIEWTNSLPLPLKFKKAILMTEQARFNPLKYVQGLANYLKQQNCFIYENTQVTELKENGDICTLRTPQGTVKAKKVILATHTPIGINHLQLFLAPYRSYALGIRFKENNYPEGHFWGLDKDQYIISTHAIGSNEPDILLVSGYHHKTGQGKDELAHYQELEKFIKKNLPAYEVVYRWSAQHYQSADQIPYIGLASKSASHTYLATGFFADGLIYGTIAAKILSNLILKNDGQLADIYNSNRSDAIASAAFVTKENFNVFLQYLKDLPWTLPKEYHNLKPGEGKIVEIDNEKWGVSCDSHNQIHMVSAVCTHMKCIVDWNNSEKTWDCPCHGSRFSEDGKVIEGPAIQNLEHKKL